MKNGDSLVGKWGAYYLRKSCCSGYGQIVEVSGKVMAIDEYPEGYKTTVVPISNVKVFDTLKEASECFHEDDEKREEIFRKECMDC